MSDDFNMSMRKFLKQVGVTSQQAIEEALRIKEAKGTDVDELKTVTSSYGGGS